MLKMFNNDNVFMIFCTSLREIVAKLLCTSEFCSREKSNEIAIFGWHEDSYTMQHERHNDRSEKTV